MKRYLTLLLLLGTMACAQNPNPPVKSTMDPANAEATTAAFMWTRVAETMMPTLASPTIDEAFLVCSKCAKRGNGIDIWEFPGLNSGGSLITVVDHTKVTILDKITADDGRVWYQIEFNAVTGWVIEDFIGQ